MLGTWEWGGWNPQKRSAQPPASRDAIEILVNPVVKKK
jgi:hypothetical protein